MLKVLMICPEIIFPANDGVSKAIESIYLKLKINLKVKIVLTTFTKPNDFYIIDDDNRLTLIEESSDLQSFDVYIASPLIPAWKSRNFIPKNKIKIALLSDCYTYVLWRSIFMSLKFRYFSLKEIKYIFKLPLIYLSEFIIARKYDYILFQTAKDVSVASAILMKRNCRKSTNILNIEEEKLNRKTQNRDGIGWVASFDGDYIFLANHFFKNVLSPVLEKLTSSKLYILGKNNVIFVEQLKLTYPHLANQIHGENFYPNISEFYLKRKICVSPVYKGYGLINKTLESLFYGCITIGDESAFNGISGFINKKHGFIGKNKSDFINIIIENIENDNSQVTENAIKLVSALNKDWIRNDFTSQYLKKLDDNLQGI